MAPELEFKKGNRCAAHFALFFLWGLGSDYILDFAFEIFLRKTDGIGLEQWSVPVFHLQPFGPLPEVHGPKV